ncbi:tetratricopeptide repeat protein [bacterium]|nr:tetratricopeptide repeat protein [bacterium]
MKKPGIIAVLAAFVLAAVLYALPRTPQRPVEGSSANAASTAGSGSPDSLNAMVAEAVSRLERGEGSPMEAIGLLRKVVELDPNHLNANLYLGYFSVVSGQFEKALPRLEIVLQQEPRHSQALLLKGQALNGLGRKTEAKEMFQRCLETDPDPETEQLARAALSEP